MPIADLLNLPCVITCRSASGTEDARGNDVATETTLSTVCELQPLQQRQVGETTDRGEIERSKWLLVVPAGTDIGPADTVIIDAVSYEVAGEPWRARNPRTRQVSHIEATLILSGSTGEPSAS